jgi:hypothetical protein
MYWKTFDCDYRELGEIPFEKDGLEKNGRGKFHVDLCVDY